MLSRHIYLIGMPGSGKSSLGRKVAANLRLPFIDVDQRIQDVFGCTVSEIFAQHGEEAFRTVETNMLIQLTRETPGIISTGGGLVVRPINQTIMKASGVIVLIDRPLEMIKSDIKLDRRPMLAKKGLEGVDELYAQRIDIYRSAADLSIANNGSYYEGVNQLQRLILTRFQL